MWRLIAVTFAFLGWSFYELSGGSEYQPLDGSRQHIAALKRAKAEAALVRQARIDAEQDARVASAVWPAGDGMSKAGISPLGFAVLGGASSDTDADTVTRASVDLDSLPRITVTRAVAVQDAGAAKVERVTLTSAGATPQAVTPQSATPDQVAQVIKASLAEPMETRDIRQISGNRVNMRMGPGTKYSVAAKLDRGTEVEVLQSPGNGWLKLRVQDSGRVGWMAEYLVTAAN